ncbi:phage scaffolding protein [Lactococcus sp. S47]|uniref:phage scaffolding protein n=1 Tax=Lactococcus sp. S47 TaxID=2767460 RepID=UPI0019074327|nr:phage scaffolding protein [Lactococcus sp. S47]MBK0029243.1 phage scaffolding protein [Lactococcus sp. S47]
MWEFIKDILAKNTDSETGKTDLEAVMEAIKTESPKHAVPKEQYNKKAEEVDKLTTDLESAQKSNLSSEELQKQLDESVKNAKERETQFNADLASMQKTNAVKLALKDSGTVNTELLFGQVNMDNVIIQDDGKVSGLDDQLATFKESMPYLFQESSGTAKPKIVAGGNPSVTPPASYDLAKMSYKEVAKLKAEQPEVFEQLIK